MKFTRQGEVGLSIAVRESKSAAEAALMTFEVRDSGVGFDEQAATGLFQRFSQADSSITRRFGGTGLGLSICKALAEMMGGEITAQSEPGRGSCFRVTLPLARAQSLAEHEGGPGDARGRAAHMPPLESDGRALTILLAEDHPTNQKVVQMILRPTGAQIVIAENGAEAVEAMRTGAFDLVLMDMQMPVMDGLAATRAIRRLEQERPHQPRTPIVMLSANAMAQHRQDAMAAGADLHVAKPITAESLLSGISEALEMQADRSAATEFAALV